MSLLYHAKNGNSQVDESLTTGIYGKFSEQQVDISNDIKKVG